jgi:hypothetical protein
MRIRRKFLSTPLVVLTIFFGLFIGGSIQQARAQQSRVDNLLISRAENISGDKFKIVTRTPLGARVYALSQPRASMLHAIDDGLTDLFAIARLHNYYSRLNYSDYTIFIARADRKKDYYGNYSPDIAVSAGQYAGSVYDKGGYIYAAGMVIAFTPCAFIIADHEKQLDRVSTVVRYEGEHIVLYHNDRKFYEKTADHSKGGGHPILK